MKYENHKTKDSVQIQAETSCGDVETVESDSEYDSNYCFNDDTSDVDWVESREDVSWDDFLSFVIKEDEILVVSCPEGIEIHYLIQIHSLAF